MNYADIKKIDIANGEGVRVSVFVSGCNHHCKGCFNECAWDFNYGKEFTQKEINQVLEYMNHEYIEGLSQNIKTCKTSKRKISRKIYMVLYGI